MTVYDSSVLIDYLDGRDAAVAYVNDHLEERALTTPLVAFEVYQGEVYKAGEPDLDAVDGALEWIDVVDVTREIARAAAEFQYALVEGGTPLGARDAFIAGTAYALDERLVVADSDFDVPGVTDEIDVDLLPERD